MNRTELKQERDRLFNEGRYAEAEAIQERLSPGSVKRAKKFMPTVNEKEQR